MLTAENISKYYSKTPALTQVCLEIAPGTITTLIGPSGSGKSTLLRALSLIEPPDEGTVRITGATYHFPSKAPPAQLPWPDLTVVFQQLFLWPHLTLRQNIFLPLRNRAGWEPGETEQIISELGMDRFVDRYPNEVSLGQRQLAAIARAFALKPAYLLLDEITSALDIEYVGTILRQLKRRQEQGIAILLITHFISFARQSADQVLFMDGGRLLETGTSDILSQPKTKRLAEFLSLVLEAT